jgi:hypothetical protein
MPVTRSTGKHPKPAGTDLGREVARLRREMDSLRKSGAVTNNGAGSSGRLQLFVAVLALIVAVVALFRH